MLFGQNVGSCILTYWDRYAPSPLPSPSVNLHSPSLTPVYLGHHKLMKPIQVWNKVWDALIRWDFIGQPCGCFELVWKSLKAPVLLPRGQGFKEQAVEFKGPEPGKKKGPVLSPYVIRQEIISHWLFSFKVAFMLSLALKQTNRNGTHRKTFRFLQDENIPVRI